MFVRRGKGGPLAVVEYSELDPSLSSAVNQETGRLRFCWSNVNSTSHLSISPLSVLSLDLCLYFFPHE